MKKIASIIALFAIAGSVWLTPSSAAAVPKMNVKIALGVGSTTTVSRVPEIPIEDWETGEDLGIAGGRSPSTFFNWGMQISARVVSRKVFGEIGIGFSRFYFEVPDEFVSIVRATPERTQEQIDGVAAVVGQTARMNSLEIPLTAGYVPYANPYFKLFLYGGWISTFHIRGFVDIDGQRKGLRFKPKDLPGYPLSIYVAGARFGAQFDLGPFNFDFSYTISMNSFTKTDFRTNSHVFKFFLGWLF